MTKPSSLRRETPGLRKFVAQKFQAAFRYVSFLERIWIWNSGLWEKFKRANFFRKWFLYVQNMDRKRKEIMKQERIAAEPHWKGACRPKTSVETYKSLLILRVDLLKQV